MDFPMEICTFSIQRSPRSPESSNVRLHLNGEVGLHCECHHHLKQRWLRLQYPYPGDQCADGGQTPRGGMGAKKNMTCWRVTMSRDGTCHIKSPGLQVRLFGIHQCESTTLWFLFIWGWLYWIKLYSDVGLELDMNYLRSYTCIEYVVGTRGWWIRLSDHNGSLWVRCK